MTLLAVKYHVHHLRLSGRVMTLAEHDKSLGVIIIIIIIQTLPEHLQDRSQGAVLEVLRTSGTAPRAVLEKSL